jgi:hypothetical protein
MAKPLPQFDPDFASPADWAAMYRACGLQVIPGWLPGEGAGSWKRPFLSQWQPLQEQLVPQAQFERWYGPGGEHAGRTNMGLITGRCSRNALIVDLDEHKNPAAMRWWLAVIAVENNGIDLETPEQRTGGGGRQKLFLAPEGYVVPTIKTANGVDIRGQGGFAVLPPSIHESQHAYAWLPGRAPWEIEIEVAPDWLLRAIEDLAAAYGGGPRTSTASPGTAKNEFGTTVDGREGLMRDIVWHAVLELYRACPIQPADAESREACARAYLDYERKVTTRLPDVASKTDALEREGRGTTLFWQKWMREMRHWGSPKMVEAAARPNPDADAEDPAAEFQQASAQAEEAATANPAQQFGWLDVRGIKALSDPVWEIHNVVPEGTLGFIYGPPGCLKTFIALDMALALATRRPVWWGHGIARGGAVIYISSEGVGSLKFRLMAWESHRRVAADDAPFYLIRETLNFMSGDDVGKLLATVGAIAAVAAVPIAAVFVDTVSRVLPGAEENLQKDMTLFVAACDAVRQRFATTVIGLHHTNANGGFRGSTVMPAAGDFMLEVRREPGAMVGSIFAKKIKDAEDGWEQFFRVTEVVVSDISGRTSLVVDNDPGRAPHPSGWPDVMVCRQILDAIRAAWDAGAPWSISPQAVGRYAPRVMVVQFQIDAKVARAIIETWLVNNVLSVETYDAHSKLKGLKVIGEIA